MLCYCCSGKAFAECCQPYLSGQAQPDNCERLMRSRYSAFCVADSQYLLATLAAEQRASESAAALEAFAKAVHFCKLEVKHATSEPKQGQVSFIASFIQHNKLEFIAEVSDFIFQDRWYYTSGRLTALPAIKLGANDPCPCGSGKKFKRCQVHLPSGQLR